MSILIVRAALKIKTGIRHAIMKPLSVQKELEVNGKTNIYFDYAATTPVDDRVLQAMLPYFNETFGNPSSEHRYGQQAEAAMEQARQTIANALNAHPDEIIFTGCGTESDNLALRGTAFARREAKGRAHMLISPVEHHAVTHTAQQLAQMFGFQVEYLEVDENGMVDPASVEACVREDTAVVSVIYGNNEIGTVNPIAEIGAVCRERGIAFHTDAVQAAAHLPIDVQADQIDLMAIGAHKFYGPKGVGALYVRRGTEMAPILTGGKQEDGMRAGTQNVPYIVGMAEALRLVREEMEERTAKLIPMRDRLIGRVLESIPQVRLTGHPSRRLSNHASFAFENVDGNALLMMLDVAGFSCSSGSACKSGTPKPSEVLLAIGLQEPWARGALRVTMGKDTQPEQVDRLADVLPGIVEQARSL